MNGECIRSSSLMDDPQSPGSCKCFTGWTGRQCEVLDLLPVPTTNNKVGGDSGDGNGLKLPNHTSSWGGSIIERDGKFHMFASEIVNQCGLEYWTTNSQVIRAVSNHYLGPYEKEEVIVPIFAHDANIVEAPTGELVLFVTSRRGMFVKNQKETILYEFPICTKPNQYFSFLMLCLLFFCLPLLFKYPCTRGRTYGL